MALSFLKDIVRSSLASVILEIFFIFLRLVVLIRH